MKCTECGFTLWSKESEALGAHVECVIDDEDELLDLESQLEKAMEDECSQ